MKLKTSTWIVITLLSFQQLTHAQFDKYRSRSNLNNNNNDGLPSVDQFGRGTGVKGADAPKSEDKFVNLNPETAFGPEIIESFGGPNLNLEDLTKQMVQLTGLNIIIDKEVKGKVSILANSAITVGDAWKAFLTALDMNGYAIVKSGAFYKIINSRDVRYTPTKIYTGHFTPETDTYIMRIIPLAHIDATEISRSFRPFMSRYGRIIEIKQTNTVIVLDTGTNINRLMRLITFLDVPGHEESLHIVKVNHSSAQEIATLLDKILKGGSSGSSRSSRSKTRTQQDASSIRIIAEPRTNTIIAMATAQGYNRLKNLIAKLDVPNTSSGSGKIHVFYLRYADAEATQKTLSGLVQSSSSSRRSSRLSRRSRSDDDSASIFNGDVKVTADKNNNALVVTAAPTDWLTIKNVLDKLDIPKDQVYVEGMILETSVDSGNTLGTSIIGGYGSGQAQKAGFTGGSDGATDLAAFLSNNITALGGLFLGAGIGRKVDFDIGGETVTLNSVNALIQAIASDSRSNVIATPQILALDNEEAVFTVGESVPVSAAVTGTNGTSVPNVEEQEATLELNITPQINKVTRFIKLKITQKIDNFSDRTVNNGGGGLAKTKRQAKTSVVVRDRDTIAMGGLMRDQVTETYNKVPLLGDIPILGWLFKRRTKSRSKLNLLLFLTPKIISPYEKVAAENLKDILNRRSAHLKFDEDQKDENLSMTKSLYLKAKKQLEGPLYNKEDASKYREQNEGAGIGNAEEVKEEELPNYQQIAEEAKAKVKKEKPANTPADSIDELDDATLEELLSEDSKKENEEINSDVLDELLIDELPDRKKGTKKANR